MSETSDDPVPYQVSYTEYVRIELVKLVARAQERGLGSEVRVALREIDRRLHVYPQFGDSLIDLSHEPGEIRIGTVPPLVVRYAVYRDMRLVFVSTPIEALRHSGLSPSRPRLRQAVRRRRLPLRPGRPCVRC